MVDLATQIQRVEVELPLKKEVLNKKMLMFEAEYAAKHNTAQQEMEFFRREKEDLRGEVLLLRRALQRTIGPIRMKVP